MTTKELIESWVMFAVSTHEAAQKAKTGVPLEILMHELKLKMIPDHSFFLFEICFGTTFSGESLN